MIRAQNRAPANGRIVPPPVAYPHWHGKGKSAPQCALLVRIRRSFLSCIVCWAHRIAQLQARRRTNESKVLPSFFLSKTEVLETVRTCIVLLKFPRGVLPYRGGCPSKDPRNLSFGAYKGWLSECRSKFYRLTVRCMAVGVCPCFLALTEVG